MKLPIILRNDKGKIGRGFLTVEIMIAFSIFTLFTISTFTLISSIQNMKIWSIKELIKLKNSVQIMDDFIDNSVLSSDLNVSMYGNDSFKIGIEPFNIIHSDLINSWGRDTCFPRINFDQKKIQYFDKGIDLGIGNISTDLEVRNNIIYLTTDSATASKPDLYIINAENPSNPIIISSLNTGPGLRAIEVAGPYAYVANSGTTAQLQIIDIHNRSSPMLVSKFRLPLPQASTSPTIGNSIFYNKGFIYLGTMKWDGPEFNIIDVSNPLFPILVGNSETNTLINDIYIRENRAYLATSDMGQMRVLDISNKGNPILLFTFSPNGWQTQEGKTIDLFENRLNLGRTVGGFNVKANHEIFTFATSSVFTSYFSQDIPGGVYGILSRPPNIFLLTHFSTHEFQVWDSDLKNKIYDFPLGNMSLKMICDQSSIFFATGNEKGISIIKLN